jgi:hypothetical protein
MTLIKKIDVNEHFAVRRRMRRAAAGLLSQPDATGFSGPEAASAKAKASGFREDYSLEHSSPSVSATPRK